MSRWGERSLYGKRRSMRVLYTKLDHVAGSDSVRMTSWVLRAQRSCPCARQTFYRTYRTYLFRVEIAPGTAVLPCTLVCRFVLHGLTGRRRHSTLYPVHGTRSLWGPYMSCAAGRYVLWSLQRCCWAVFPDILDLQLFGTALRWLRLMALAAFLRGWRWSS